MIMDFLKEAVQARSDELGFQYVPSQSEIMESIQADSNRRFSEPTLFEEATGGSTQSETQERFPEEGFSSVPQARIEILGKQFLSAKKQDRRALFNEAFKEARRAGMQEFSFAGRRYTTELAVPAPKPKIIPVPIPVEDARGKAQMTDATKAEFDRFHGLGMTPPKEVNLRQNNSRLEYGVNKEQVGRMLQGLFGTKLWY